MSVFSIPGRQPAFYFHVHRNARTTCDFDEGTFSFSGDVIFADFASADRFASKLGDRDLCHVGAPTLFAMGLLHEVMHALIGFARNRGMTPFAEATAELSAADAAAHEKTLTTFAREFPTPAVFKNELTPEQELARTRDSIPGGERALEELVLLELTNNNPAYNVIAPLLDDKVLRDTTNYLQTCAITAGHLGAANMNDGTGKSGDSLFDWLTAPMRHAPHSIFAQLEFARAHFGAVLREMGLERRLLFAIDVLQEQQWLGRKAHGYGGRMEPMKFGSPKDEPERFTEDKDWMPRVVMIAKSTFVWLHQLEKSYGRPVRSLADVPDQELDELARRGFNALWLIGMWRRSTASREIKQRMGKGDALASAYSLDDYEVADDLGGYLAYCSLRDRAQARGIRLASDMVPNHMGIDSRWVKEHPDRFLQRDHAPYGNYTYNGPNLSHDDRVGLYLEDGYWTRSDAAVTFKRVDHHTGAVAHIYHGNDGTSMPWNDTAQLDYSKAHVREAVIQTILHVARMFPIIRFDAAMTLAKKHVQRLWFPLPGHGGAIPSRSESAMTEAEFEAALPEEFWREVVDRVAREAPDTLLLAEAFWMMEGYFVRTLGMHRVYNSAFMNMLKTEDNARFRDLIKNVLIFDPRVLERFVNFMNNPDEEPAVAQFGSDDKYFGVCTLMSTLPGLPMFGHGQVEGFHEKYGMEFAKPETDESPNSGLIDRHDREIFPLLRARHLFSGVANFHLIDCEGDGGGIDEDVIAYTNRVGNSRTVVAYNNKYKQARGWLRRSASFRDLGSGELRSRSLAEALDLPREGWLVLADHRTGLEQLAPAWKLHDEGFRVELEAFKYVVIARIETVTEDAQHPYAALHQILENRAVKNVRNEARMLYLAPIIEAVAKGMTAVASGETASESIEQIRTALTTLGYKSATTTSARAIPATDPSRTKGMTASTSSKKSSSPAAKVSSPAAKKPPRTGTPPVRDGGAEKSWSQQTSITLVRSLVRFTETVLTELSLYVENDAPGHFGFSEILVRAFAIAEGVEVSAEERAFVADLLVATVVLRSGGAPSLASNAERLFLGVHEHEGVQWFKKERADAVALLVAHERTDLMPLASAMTALADTHGYRFLPWVEALTSATASTASSPSLLEVRAP